MKTRFFYPCLVMLSTLGILSSCKKEAASTSSKTTTTASSSATGAIALSAVTESGSSTKTLFTLYTVSRRTVLRILLPSVRCLPASAPI